MNPQFRSYVGMKPPVTSTEIEGIAKTGSRFLTDPKPSQSSLHYESSDDSDQSASSTDKATKPKKPRSILELEPVKHHRKRNS